MIFFLFSFNFFLSIFIFHSYSLYFIVLQILIDLKETDGDLERLMVKIYDSNHGVVFLFREI